MAEVGNMPLPPQVLRKGSTDLVRISDEELKARVAKWVRPEPPLKSGYWKLYVDTVLQADEGCDLNFLVGKRGAFVPKDNH